LGGKDALLQSCANEDIFGEIRGDDEEMNESRLQVACLSAINLAFDFPFAPDPVKMCSLAAEFETNFQGREMPIGLL
jgi:hypothetical protein